MGETVDALAVGAPSFLRSWSRAHLNGFIKLEITDPESAGEVYRLLYARCLMIGMRRRQTKSQSTR